MWRGKFETVKQHGIKGSPNQSQLKALPIDIVFKQALCSDEMPSLLLCNMSLGRRLAIVNGLRN